ncbi:hypothetical protein niasHT_014872 [Heterodera trifolii]|uniref:Uncharacterized protein n=1 Tax=Heterodera trifolii TaxID=157864 RepID=A0ABD2L890_9BILA
MSSSPSAAVFIFAYSFFSIELITCVAVLAIAFLNLAVIVPTKLLHLNLKSILITQTVATIIFVGDRSIMLVHKFTFSNNIFAPADMTLQIAENVKTSQQLLPTFFGIFLSNLSLSMNYVIMWFKLLNEKDYQISVCFAIFICVNTIICGVIELTVITHHPMLKRRFLRLLKMVSNFRRNRIDNVPPIAVELNGIGCKKNENETTEHFKMLQQAWNK